MKCLKGFQKKLDKSEVHIFMSGNFCNIFSGDFCNLLSILLLRRGCALTLRVNTAVAVLVTLKLVEHKMNGEIGRLRNDCTILHLASHNAPLLFVTVGVQ